MARCPGTKACLWFVQAALLNHIFSRALYALSEKLLHEVNIKSEPANGKTYNGVMPYRCGLFITIETSTNGRVLAPLYLAWLSYCTVIPSLNHCAFCTTRVDCERFRALNLPVLPSSYFNLNLPLILVQGRSNHTLNLSTPLSSYHFSYFGLGGKSLTAAFFDI